VKVTSETGKKGKIFFYKAVVTSMVFIAKRNISRVEEMPSSYLNERQKFGYMVSSEMCHLKDLEIMKIIEI
jgi:hypothetical protein